MNEYEIPLNAIEDGEEKSGPYILINGTTVRIADYSGEPPHDVVTLYRSETRRLVSILIDWLASETKIHGLFGDEYKEYKNDEE